MNKSNNNYKRRGKKPSGKVNTRGVDKEVREEKYNDPTWYVASGQLLKDFASLSFNNALGATSRIPFNEYDGDLELNDIRYVAPGIMSIFTAPSFGITLDGSSAVNLAAKNFYTYIRHQNSGHANYDSPDLMMYFGAMDSAYSLLASMIRAYGIAMTFSQVNRYIGDALLSASGFAPLDIRANLADFRGYINMCITKLSAFCTPITMTMFKRHFWMYSGVYRDENVVKSQTYMYVPAVLWRYNEAAGPGQLTSFLAFAENAAGGLNIKAKTFAEVRTLMNTCLSALVGSEDINIMSGDILKAYGSENLWKLSLIPEDYAVLPVYSEEVLDQIHNTVFGGSIPVQTTDLSTYPTLSINAFDVIQDPEVGEGAIYSRPQFLNAAHLGFDAIVDMHKDDPTPEDVIVATRNIITGKSSKITGRTDVVTSLTSCGSDIPLFGVITKFTENGNNYTLIRVFNNQNPNSSALLAELSTFNKYPHYISVDQSTGAIGMFGELDNYTVVSHDDIGRMHDTACLSLLGVPFLGTATK